MGSDYGIEISKCDPLPMRDVIQYEISGMDEGRSCVMGDSLKDIRSENAKAPTRRKGESFRSSKRRW